ncbi:hypothetical protein ACFFU8_18030 [Chromobacterium piscinae]|uniref:hypothetical protein n=1 Tax=Chromobacterium piscinae TaxID=686831 RepID=UPI001E440E9F|nr:hypothetical protein [Chromobacterium piscinae]MCD5326785.1 hypothetical protein [Chromobacterium piscinae]
MSRKDMSDFLVHWTKEVDGSNAFDNLFNIYENMELLGGSGFIKGDYRCVCFTEAPEGTFHDVWSRYSGFGVKVRKDWLFAKGGRPVIYQSDDEYDLLHEDQKWRHVRYEPCSDFRVDFTWEREWRYHGDILSLEEECVSLIVPDEESADRFLHWHNTLEAHALGEYYIFPSPLRVNLEVLDRA